MPKPQPRSRSSSGSRSSAAGGRSRAGGRVGGERTDELTPAPLDEFSSGLPENFYGLCRSARLVATNYGNRDKYSLAVRLDLVSDDESLQKALDDKPPLISAGDLAAFVPSMEWPEPAGASIDDYLAMAHGEGLPDGVDLDECVGIFALPIGDRKKLSGTSNWAQFFAALKDAKFPPEKIAEAGGAFTFLDGTYGYWVRIKQQERPSLDETREKPKYEPTLLVLAEYVEHRDVEEEEAPRARGRSAGAASKGAVSTSKPAGRRQQEEEEEPEEEPEAEEATEGEEGEGEEEQEEETLEDAVEAEILNVLKLPKYKKAGIKKPALAPLVTSEFSGKERSEVVAVLNDEKWLKSKDRKFKYNPGDRSFSLK